MRRIAWVLLLAFSFTIPWEYSLDLGAPLGNIARIAGVIVLLAFVPAVLQAGRMRAPGPVQWLVLALFLWFCSSYFWTINSPASAFLTRGPARIGFSTLLVVWMVTSLVATVEGNRSTWFLLALISVAGRLAVDAPMAMSSQFGANTRFSERADRAETIA